MNVTTTAYRDFNDNELDDIERAASVLDVLIMDGVKFHTTPAPYSDEANDAISQFGYMLNTRRVLRMVDELRRLYAQNQETNNAYIRGYVDGKGK